MSYPRPAVQHDTPLKTELSPVVMSRNDAGVWWAIEYSSGGTNPGPGQAGLLGLLIPERDHARHERGGRARAADERDRLAGRRVRSPERSCEQMIT